MTIKVRDRQSHQYSAFGRKTIEILGKDSDEPAVVAWSPKKVDREFMDNVVGELQRVENERARLGAIVANQSRTLAIAKDILDGIDNKLSEQLDI